MTSARVHSPSLLLTLTLALGLVAPPSRATAQASPASNGEGTAASTGTEAASSQGVPDGATEPAPPAGLLASELSQVIREAGWPDDRWSVLAVSLTSGDTIFAHNPGSQLAPASNLKLFTTAAALHYLGPDYRYSTYVAAHGPVRNGVLEGDLILYGTGDPTISGRFNASQTAAFESLADSLVAMGVQRVTGDVVGDGSYFQGSGVARGWQTTYTTHTYAAPSGALNFNDNVITFHVKPGAQAGAPPEVTLLPAGTVAYQSTARTVTSGRTHVEVKRESYDAPLVLTGQMVTGSSPVWRAVPVPDPAIYTAAAFAEVLVERGIQVDGQVRSQHAESGSAVSGQRVFAPSFEDERPVQVLAIHRSPPLKEILAVINQRSHNLYADAVLRTVGRVVTGEGSLHGGAAAVHALLGEDSPEAATVRMEDGSGLSRLNRSSASALVALLAFMESSDFRDQYLETLPEAAVDRGLRRMQQTPAAGNLRAKTGTIDGVSALSGYVTAQNGERLAFAIISNDVPSTWRAKRIEDRIGGRLASVDRPVPSPDARGPGAGVLASRSADEAEEADASGAPSETGEVAGDPGAQANAPAPSPPSTASAAPADNTRTYVIQGGDTLEGIARRHGVTLSELEAANPGLDPRRLMPGQELSLPSGD